MWSPTTRNKSLLRQCRRAHSLHCTMPHPARVQVQRLPLFIAVQILVQVTMGKDDAALEEGVRRLPSEPLQACDEILAQV